MTRQEAVAKRLCAASQDDWATGKVYWLALAAEVLDIADRDSGSAPQGENAAGG